MPNDFSHLNEEERLKEENEFLKMKMMLEHGAQFEGGDDIELPPEIENEFLNNVMLFEKQFEEHKTIRLFDKIGRPLHFKPVNEIPDTGIDEAWRELSEHLNVYGVDLSVCSPNISVRELYRFTIEELFEHEMDDMTLPGWTTNFIYDEFYPDPIYDNSRLVQQDLLQDIFRKGDLFFEVHYAKDGFIFNGKEYKEFKIYEDKINRFKSIFDEIELLESSIDSCQLKDKKCVITGSYKAAVITSDNETILEGEFEVMLIEGEMEYWDMKKIQIDDFDPG